MEVVWYKSSAYPEAQIPLSITSSGYDLAGLY